MGKMGKRRSNRIRIERPVLEQGHAHSEHLVTEVDVHRQDRRDEKHYEEVTSQRVDIVDSRHTDGIEQSQGQEMASSNGIRVSGDQDVNENGTESLRNRSEERVAHHNYTAERRSGTGPLSQNMIRQPGHVSSHMIEGTGVVGESQVLAGMGKDKELSDAVSITVGKAVGGVVKQMSSTMQTMQGVLQNIMTRMETGVNVNQSSEFRTENNTEQGRDRARQRGIAQARLQRTHGSYSERDLSSSDGSEVDVDGFRSESSNNIFHSERQTRVGRSNQNVGVKLPTFTGRESWKVWINRFSAIADRRQWTDDDRLDELLPRLQGAAGEFVYNQLSMATLGNFRSLVQELDNRYRVIETTKTYGGQFSKRGQKQGETVEEYAAELKRLYDKAHPDRDRKTHTEDLLRRFLDGLYDDRARFQVEYVKEPDNIDEAVYHVVNFLQTKSRPASFEQYHDRKFKKMTRRTTSSALISDDEENKEAGSLSDSGLSLDERVNRVPAKNETTKENRDGQRVTIMPNNVKRENDMNKDKDMTSDVLQKQTLKQLMERIEKLELELKQAQQQSKRTDGANKNRNQYRQYQQKTPFNKGNQHCHACGQPGHYARDNECPIKRTQGQIQNNRFRVPTQYVGQQRDWRGAPSGDNQSTQSLNRQGLA